MKRTITYIYLPLAAFYLFMTVVFPIDPATIARRHLSLSHARVVSLSVAIPIIIIWLLALYGSRLFYEHSQSIKKSADGPPLIQLAFGVQLLAWYLPVRVLSKIILNYMASLHPFLQNPFNIILIYFNLAVPLVAFIIISRAARNLGNLAKIKNSLGAIYGLTLAFITIGVSYCYANFGVQSSDLPGNWLVTTQGSIPLPLRITTIIIPYLFMWFIGLQAAYEINLYQKQVKGTLYRRSLRLLSVGLIMVILVSIGIQFFTAVAANLQSLPFAAVLVIAFSLIVLLGIAFVVIAKGVRQFKWLGEA